uniref:Uncharacterized protein n=1 Tax=Anguilla anguilla TaxID=7936 RepID=A0A0E9USE4_ANGAN
MNKWRRTKEGGQGLGDTDSGWIET